MREIINVGSAPNDNTGDSLRMAGQKMNANFAELYDWTGASSNLAFRTPAGTTEQRPAIPQKGHIRYNTSTETMEGYIGSPPSWQSLSFGFVPENFVRLAGENNLGPMSWTQGTYAKFGHSFQVDANDGRIGAGLLQPGLNIIGTRTVSGEQRRIHLYGWLTSEGSMQVAGRVATASTGWLSAPNGGFNTVLVDAGAAAGQISINGPTATFPTLTFEKGGVDRWLLRAGNNATADFLLQRHNSSGVFQDTPITISGLDGVVTILSATANTLRMNRRTSSNGGILTIQSPSTGTTISGDVAIEIVANQLRISETGGTFRGFNLDLTAGTAAAAATIWHSGNLNPANYLPLAGGTMTGAVTLFGNSTAVTQAVDNNTTRIATTAFVIGQAASTAPLMDGTAAVGTSLRFARADHVHPRDTGLLALSGGTMTGPLTLSSAPTADLHAATRKYVDDSFSAATGGPGGVIDRVLRTGDTMTGNLTLNLSAPFLILNKAANNSGTLRFSNGGNVRWDVVANSTSETGSNAGSNFAISSYNDAGAFLGTPFQIVRSTSQVIVQPWLFVQAPSGSAHLFLQKQGSGLTSRLHGLNMAGQTRWQLDLGDGDVEAGADTGSNFSIHRYNDLGVYQDTPFRLFRDSGRAFLTHALSAQQLQARGGGSEGGHITLNYTGNTLFSSQGGNSTWNIDVSAANALRIFAQSAAGSLATPLSIAADGGAISMAAPSLQLNHATAARFVLNNTDAAASSVVEGTRNGVLRWRVAVGNEDAESTGNLGSNFAIQRFTNAGALIDTPIQINRSSGAITLNNATTIGNNLTVTSATTNTQLTLDNPSTGRARVLMTRSNLARWALDLGNASAETGGNAGTDVILGRFDDAGVFLGNVFVISRSTGVVSFTQPVSIFSAPTDTLHATNKSYVDSQDALYLPLAGGAMTNGLSFGSALAANSSTNTRHIALFSNTYGFNVTSNRLNISFPTTGVVQFVRGTADVATVEAGGTSVPNATSIITREKGDARYPQLATMPFVELAARIGITGTPSTVEFALPEGYARYDFTFNDLSPTATSNFGFQVSRDNGATWLSTNQYVWAFQTSLSTFHGSGVADALGRLFVTANPGFSLGGKLSLYPSPNNARNWLYECSTVGVSSSNTWEVSQLAGTVQNATARFNRIRFFFNGTTFAAQGSISIHGVRW